MKNSSKITLVLAIVILLLTYNLWYVVKLQFGVSIFYQGISLTFLSLSFVIWNEFKSRISELFITMCVTNLIDELFFNPTKFEVNEYIGYLIAIFIIFRESILKRLKTLF